MNLLHDIPLGDKSPEEFNVVIEIPRGSSNKYEYDNKKGVFELDRVLRSPLFYPTDYGFAPQSWYDDNDPIDVLMMSTFPTFPGCVVKVRPVALLRMEDEKGEDDKLLVVPVGDAKYEHIRDVDDIPEWVRKEINEFFEIYKNLEPGKWVKVKKWENAKVAKEVVGKAKKMYADKFKKK
jgi:inorganic pyrophosphatase